MYQKESNLLYRTGAVVLVGAVGLTSLLGCDNKPVETSKPPQKPTSSQPESLENKLDLSTPEKAVLSYVKYVGQEPNYELTLQIITPELRKKLETEIGREGFYKETSKTSDDWKGDKIKSVKYQSSDSAIIILGPDKFWVKKINNRWLVHKRK